MRRGRRPSDRLDPAPPAARASGSTTSGGWPAARPDLVPAYEELYPRSYAPKAAQDRVARMVSELVERHGGRPARPSGTRPPSKPRRRPSPVPVEKQLGLGL